MRFCEIVVIDFLQHIWYFIIEHLVFHLKKMTTNLFSICLSNSNSVAGYCALIVLVHLANYAPTKSCLDLHFYFAVFPVLQELSHNLLQSTDQQVDYLLNLTDLLYGPNTSIVSTEMVVLYPHQPQEGQVLCRFLEDLFIHLQHY